MIKNPLPWPKGNRCAATFSWDMDADSIIHMAHPDDANTRVSTMSYLRYGPQIAVERICDLFEKYGLKTTFFCPGWSMEEHPYAVERILKGGHELAHHGYMHELPNLNTRDREAYWTGRAVETHVRMAGKKPAGYRGAVVQLLAQHHRDPARPRLSLRQLADGRRRALQDPLAHGS